MRKLIAHIWLPVVVGFAVTMPFFLLELVNRPPGITEFPVALFLTLWLSAGLGTLTFRQALRSEFRTPALTAHNAVYALCIVALIVTATLWIGLVNDQMPCFMGVPNCD